MNTNQEPIEQQIGFSDEFTYNDQPIKYEITYKVLSLKQDMCTRGDLYYADLPIMKDSQVQQGVRPVLIISNDKANKYSPVINVIPLTTCLTKTQLPTHVTLIGYGLPKQSVLLAEQILSIDKKKLLGKIGSVNDESTLAKINRAINIQLDMIA